MAQAQTKHPPVAHGPAILPSPSAAEALLLAAEELFAGRGYADVGIREIADRAGVNLSLIKYHFGSKKQLYLATVRRAMGRGDGPDAWSLISDPPPDPAAAGQMLARFIDRFLCHLLRENSATCSCGRLLIREGLEPTEAIETVIADYVRPNHMALRALVARIQPQLGESERGRAVSSVLGQILHHFIFRSFIERTTEVDLNDEAPVARIAAHITAFSLRGMRCDERLIEDVMKSVFPDSIGDEEVVE